MSQLIPETKVNTIRMPKSFLKNGGEEYILGQGKMSSNMEAVVEVFTENLNEICTWKPFGESQFCSIISYDKDSKFKGIKTFIIYKLQSSYSDKIISRRYKQFDWLHTQLSEKYPCIAIPPLPNKQVVGKYEDNFIEGRRRHLQKWLTHVTSHPVLSYSNTMKHFLSVTDKDKWTTGKRNIERDNYKGGRFYCAVEAPLDEISWDNYSKRIDKVSNFIENFEKNARSLQEVYNGFHKRQSGPICKEFQKIGSSITNLSKSMSFSPDKNRNDIALSHGLQKTGEVYQKIGTLFRDQAKVDADLVEDNLEELNGVTKEIPSLIDLAKCAVNTIETSTRKSTESKINLEILDGIDRNVRVITRTVDAELSWLQNQRESHLRSTMVQYLKNQIQLYTQITAILTEAHDSFCEPDNVTQSFRNGP